MLRSVSSHSGVCLCPDNQIAGCHPQSPCGSVCDGRPRQSMKVPRIAPSTRFGKATSIHLGLKSKKLRIRRFSGAITNCRCLSAARDMPFDRNVEGFVGQNQTSEFRSCEPFEDRRIGYIPADQLMRSKPENVLPARRSPRPAGSHWHIMAFLGCWMNLHTGPRNSLITAGSKGTTGIVDWGELHFVVWPWKSKRT